MFTSPTWNDQIQVKAETFASSLPSFGASLSREKPKNQWSSLPTLPCSQLFPFEKHEEKPIACVKRTFFFSLLKCLWKTLVLRFGNGWYCFVLYGNESRISSVIKLHYQNFNFDTSYKQLRLSFKPLSAFLNPTIFEVGYFRQTLWNE